MNRSSIPFAALLMLAAALIGCQATPQSASAPVQIAGEEYPRMYQAAIDVLRDNGYTIDRDDYRFGTVATDAEQTSTLFEPWRRNGATFVQAANATTNRQRRVVRVQMEPIEHTDQFNLYVEAVVEQLQLPTRYLTGSTRGPAIFGHLRSVPEEHARRGITEGYWQTVERDPLLEQRLLDEIVRQSVRIDSPAATEPAETPAS
jgi:hypothetical protein